MLDVDVTKDSVGQETTAGPAIDTKHVQTQVRVDNGGTVAIGGIYTQEDHRDTTGVPWLGHLPLIGVLFRQRATSHSKGELMIFITPTEISPDVSDDFSPKADGSDVRAAVCAAPPTAPSDRAASDPNCGLAEPGAEREKNAMNAESAETMPQKL